MVLQDQKANKRSAGGPDASDSDFKIAPLSSSSETLKGCPPAHGASRARPGDMPAENFLLLRLEMQSAAINLGALSPPGPPLLLCLASHWPGPPCLLVPSGRRDEHSGYQKQGLSEGITLRVKGRRRGRGVTGEPRGSPEGSSATWKTKRGQRCPHTRPLLSSVRHFTSHRTTPPSHSCTTLTATRACLTQTRAPPAGPVTYHPGPEPSAPRGQVQFPQDQASSPPGRADTLVWKKRGCW